MAVVFAVTGSAQLFLDAGDTAYVPAGVTVITSAVQEPIFGLVTVPGSIETIVDGTLISPALDGIDLDGFTPYGGAFRVDVNATGVVRSLAATESGVHMDDYRSTLHNRGEITGGSGVDLSNCPQSLIDNAGLIAGDGGAGLLFADCVDVRVVNTGTITGDVGIRLDESYGRIVNAGTIIGTGAAGRAIVATPTAAGLEIVNTGLIAGSVLPSGTNIVAVEFGNANDSLRNAGAIVGVVFLGGGHDLYQAQASGRVSDYVSGGTGNDMLTGAAADDVLFGDGNNDTLSGGGGADLLLGGAGIDVITGGDGDDTVDGGTGNDNIRGGEGDDSLAGGDNDDGLRGGTGDDSLTGAAGADQMFGNGGDDVLQGGTEADTLSGNAGEDVLFGEAGTDVLNGGSGDDLLDGGTEADALRGAAGNDTLTGGAGFDTLTGGVDADTFVFASAAEIGTAPGARDQITDVRSGIDTISLADIDASTLAAGNQTFVYIGATAFSGVAGQLRYSIADGLLQGDVNGDNMADFSLHLTTRPVIVAADILL